MREDAGLDVLLRRRALDSKARWTIGEGAAGRKRESTWSMQVTHELLSMCV